MNDTGRLTINTITNIASVYTVTLYRHLQLLESDSLTALHTSMMDNSNPSPTRKPPTEIWYGEKKT